MTYDDVLNAARRRWPKSNLSLTVICSEGSQRRFALMAVLDHWCHRIERMLLDEVYEAILTSPAEVPRK